VLLYQKHWTLVHICIYKKLAAPTGMAEKITVWSKLACCLGKLATDGLPVHYSPLTASDTALQ